MKSFCRIAGLIIFILSAFMICTSLKEYKIAFGESANINEVYPDEFENVNGVEAEFQMLLGCFLYDESVIKNKNGQAKYSICEYYYVVPIFVEKESYFVGVLVDSAKEERYENLSDLTMKYLRGEGNNLEGEAIEFQGRLKAMDEETYEYFREWFIENGYLRSDEQINKYVLPYIFESMNYKNIRTTAYVMFGAFLLSIIMMICGRNTNKAKIIPASQELITINDVTYPSNSLAEVNILVQNGKKDKAIKSLQKLTNLDVEASKMVIEKWDKYW